MIDDIFRYFDGFQPDINSMILGALTLLIFILIVYLIIFSRNIAKAAKRANKTMENIEKISAITLKKSMQLDSASNDFVEAMSKVASAIKGQQSLVSAITVLVNSFSSIKKLYPDKNSMKDESEPTTASKYKPCDKK